MATIPDQLESVSSSRTQFLVTRPTGNKVAPARKQIAPGPENQGIAELSFAQERFWTLEQLTPGNALYNMSGAAHVTGPLDLALWDDALNAVVGRHSVLRATFVTGAGRPHVSILPCLNIVSGIKDMRDAGDAEVRAALAEEARKPFDLGAGPLIRSLIVRKSHDEHFLLLTMHHIVADGLSTRIFFRELAEFYSSSQMRRPPRLPELTVQYDDFAFWQRRWMDSETTVSQLNYWKRQLADVPHFLKLPADRPRPATRAFAGLRHPIRLGSRLTASLRDLSRKEGVTLFVTLLAGFAGVLSRYTNQSDFVVGTPVAGREFPEVQNLIGCFLNTLALRTDLGGNPTFRELLQRIRAVVLGAFANREVPFERVLEALNVTRTANASPLFQVLFSLESNPVTGGSPSGLSIQFEEVETRTAKVDLTLELNEGPDGLNGWLEFDSSLFNSSSIARLEGHLGTLLEQMARDPEQRVADVRLMRRAEVLRITNEWNDTAREYPSQSSISAVFEKHAAETPDRLALSYGERVMSYAQLNRRANQVARCLRDHGVRTGNLIALCMDRSPEFVVGALATLKAGGAYVPLDPAYPRQRLEWMVTDAQGPVLLTTRKLAETLGTLHGTTLAIEDVAPDGCAENPGVCVSPDDVAYVMYTSGSTGKPKGIAIPHRAVNRLVVNSDYVRFRPDDRISQTSNVCFDAATFEIWGALLSGACLVGIAKDIALSPADFAVQLAEKRITTMFLTTSLFNRMAVETPGAFRGLAQLLVGGEALDPQHVRRVLRDPGRPARLLNGYGPTESTTFAAWHEIESVAEDARSIPIGRPLANTRLYVLDGAMEPCPVGVTGELYIGGDGLARGYLLRPDLTAEKFVPDPFAAERGARLYRTGDLVRFREDSTIDYLGRNDDQVKIRGFRIEPGEIETLLRTHPLVRECAVAVLESDSGAKRLVAYAAADVDANVTELRAWVSTRMPDYMVPATWVLLPEMPLNANGKVDRHALPAPDCDRPRTGRAYTAPAEGLESEIAEIWRSVLQVKDISAHDSFFELGGDSILAIQVAARCSQAGISFSPAQMMRHPTIAALAEVAGGGAAALAEQGPVSGPVPLTPIQRWFFEHDTADTHHSNQAVMLEMLRPVDPGRMKCAVAALIAHHDALRLRCRQADVETVQEISSPELEVDEMVPFTVEDLSEIAPGVRSSEIQRRAGMIQATLNPAEGPVIRVVWFDCGPGENSRLLIAVHHLAVDGVSWRILLEDLQTALEQSSRSEAVRLPLKTTSFKRWSERLHAYAAQGAFEAELPYWRAQRDPEPLRPDYEILRGQNRYDSADVVSCKLNSEETKALLQDVPRTGRTHVDELLLTALALAFAYEQNRTSLLVNVEGHGREEIAGEETLDLSRTVGWFTSISPLLIKLDCQSRLSPESALKAVRERMRRRPARGFGYGVLRYLNPRTQQELQKIDEPRISFNYLGQFDALLDQASAFRMARESCGSLHGGRVLRRHLIDVDCMVIGGRLRAEWTYSRQAYRRATIEALAATFASQLRTLIRLCPKQDPDSVMPSDFPMARLDEQKLERIARMLSTRKTGSAVKGLN